MPYQLNYAQRSTADTNEALGGVNRPYSDRLHSGYVPEARQYTTGLQLHVDSFCSLHLVDMVMYTKHMVA